MQDSVQGWKGDRVRLIPPDRSLHLENALRWLNDPEVTRCIEFNLGVSRRQEEAFFDRIESPSDVEFTWAIHDEAERHIGFIAILAIDWRQRRCSGGLLIGDRSAWGRGYAGDAVRVRTRFAFARLGLHRIGGHTFNPAMRRVYEKCGYRHEGTARQMFWADGRWHDVASYGILEEDWRPSEHPGDRSPP
jgi:RimJ/RimL family protein N-acetyltransferase